ncbi:MAG: zf-HC2 domain-containing protein [Clostridia bacterium]|nr:zf-HC2 domain-containing protein [Clostridia bacterium]
MNKKECQVMRDLMPLCIDGAASEASRELVVKHVWECEECAKVYAEMQGHLLTPKEAPDYLDEAARKLRKRRKNKRRLLVALTALLTAVLVMVGAFVWQYAFHTSQIPLGLDEYDAVLTRTEDGNVLLNLYAHDRTLCCGVGSGMEPLEDGSYMLTVIPHTTLVRKYHDEPVIGMSDNDFANAYWQDGLIYSDRYDHGHLQYEAETPHQISCIRVVCGKEERIVYRAGDDIPFCSEEMAEFYRVQEEIEALYHNEELDALEEDMIRLRQLVPEWN